MPRVYFPPIGTVAERASAKVWPGAWVDATGYNKRYRIGTPLEAYHTGADLNCNSPTWDADAHSGVYAIAEGEVIAVGRYSGWGQLIIIHHTPDGGPSVYARYAHVESPLVRVGQRVLAQEQIASVGNGDGLVAYHLHFDVSSTNKLRDNPADWPKLDRTRLEQIGRASCRERVSSPV